MKPDTLLLYLNDSALDHLTFEEKWSLYEQKLKQLNVDENFFTEYLNDVMSDEEHMDSVFLDDMDTNLPDPIKDKETIEKRKKLFLQAHDLMKNFMRNFTSPDIPSLKEKYGSLDRSLQPLHRAQIMPGEEGQLPNEELYRIMGSNSTASQEEKRVYITRKLVDELKRMDPEELCKPRTDEELLQFYQDPQRQGELQFLLETDFWSKNGDAEALGVDKELLQHYRDVQDRVFGILSTSLGRLGEMASPLFPYYEPGALIANRSMAKSPNYGGTSERFGARLYEDGRPLIDRIIRDQVQFGLNGPCTQVDCSMAKILESYNYSSRKAFESEGGFVLMPEGKVCRDIDEAGNMITLGKRVLVKNPKNSNDQGYLLEYDKNTGLLMCTEAPEYLYYLPDIVYDPGEVPPEPENLNSKEHKAWEILNDEKEAYFNYCDAHPGYKGITRENAKQEMDAAVSRFVPITEHPMGRYILDSDHPMTADRLDEFVKQAENDLAMKKTGVSMQDFVQDFMNTEPENPEEEQQDMEEAGAVVQDIVDKKPEYQIEDAKKWFESLKQSLKSEMQISSDNPLSFSRIKIALDGNSVEDIQDRRKKYGFSDMNVAARLTPEELKRFGDLTKEVLEHYPQDYYRFAFVPMNSEGEYKKPFTENDEILDWAYQNLSEGQNLSDEQILYLYQMAVENRLYIDSDEDGAEGYLDARLIKVSQEGSAFFTDKLKKIEDPVSLAKAGLDAGEKSEAEERIHNVYTSVFYVMEAVHNREEYAIRTGSEEDKADRSFRNLSLHGGVDTEKSIRRLTNYAMENPDWFDTPEKIQQLNKEFQAFCNAGNSIDEKDEKLLENSFFNDEIRELYTNILNFAKPATWKQIYNQGRFADLNGEPINAKDSLEYLKKLYETVEKNGGFLYNNKAYYKSGNKFTGKKNKLEYAYELEDIFNEIKEVASKTKDENVHNTLDQIEYQFDNKIVELRNPYRNMTELMLEQQTVWNETILGPIRNAIKKLQVFNLEDISRELHLLNKFVDFDTAHQTNTLSEYEKKYEKEILFSRARSNARDYIENVGREYNAAIRKLQNGNGNDPRTQNEIKLALAKMIAARMILIKLDNMEPEDHLGYDELSADMLRHLNRPETLDKMSEIILRSKALDVTLNSLQDYEDYAVCLTQPEKIIKDDGRLQKDQEDDQILKSITDLFKGQDEKYLGTRNSLESVFDSPAKLDARLLSPIRMSSIKNMISSMQAIPEEETTTVGRSWLERALPTVQTLLTEMNKKKLISDANLTEYNKLLDQYRDIMHEARVSLSVPDRDKLNAIVSALTEKLKAESGPEETDYTKKTGFRLLIGHLEREGQQPARVTAPDKTEEEAFRGMIERLDNTSRGMFRSRNSQSEEMKGVRDALDQVMSVLENRKKLGNQSIGEQIKQRDQIERELREASRNLESACRVYLNPESKKAENERKHIVRDILVQNAALTGRDSETLDSHSAIGKLMNAILADPSIGKKEYKAILDSLINLEAHMDQYYTPTENGTLPPFGAEDRERLMEDYRKTASCVNAFFEAHSNTQSDAYQMMEHAASLMEQDMEHLDTLVFDAERPVYLPDLIAEARVKTAEVDLEHVRAIGGNASQRFPLTVDGVKGLFTKEEKVDAIPDYMQAFENLKQTFQTKNPDLAKLEIFADPKKFLAKWLNAARNLARENGCDSDSIMYPSRRVTKSNGRLGDGFKEVTISNKSDLQGVLTAFIDSIMKDGKEIGAEECLLQFDFAEYPKAYQTMDKFNHNDIPELVQGHGWSKEGGKQKIRYNKELIDQIDESFVRKFRNKAFSSFFARQSLGLKSTDRLDSRNTAMSAMASLTGCPILLARSTPIRIKDSGRIINGTFMEAAQGVDPKATDQRIIDEIKKDGVQVEYMPEALKSMSELQMLDYLCGNLDRHRGNMFYQFEPGSFRTGKPTLKGIMGIDNDASFGNKVPENGKGLGHMVGIKNMNVISEGMAKKIMQLSPDLVSFTLRNHHLGSKAIQATKKRLLNLQKSIRESMKYYERKDVQKKIEADPSYIEAGKLRIVKENEWQNWTGDNLAKLQVQAEPGGMNLFKKLTDFKSILQPRKQEHELEFQQANVVKNNTKQMNKVR